MAGVSVLYFLISSSVGHTALAAGLRDDFKRWLDHARRFTRQSALIDLTVGAVDYWKTLDAQEYRLVLTRVLKRDINDAPTLALAAFGYNWLGEPQAARDCLAKARHLGQFTIWEAFNIAGEATAELMLGRYEKSLQLFEDGLRLSAAYPTLYRVNAAASAYRGEIDTARSVIKRLLEIAPAENVENLKTRNGYVDNDFTAVWFEGLRMAGLPEK